MSHPAESPDPVPYPEIAERARHLADEREDVPTLPEVPPPVEPPPPAKDPERTLVHVCVVLACLFFVAIFALATCQGR